MQFKFYLPLFTRRPTAQKCCIDESHKQSVRTNINNSLNLIILLFTAKTVSTNKIYALSRLCFNEEMLSFSVVSVVSAAMNFFYPCSANRPEVFSGCDKRIWIEKSSLYSTKALLISAYRSSFTFDEITAFISNSDALRF